MLIPTKKYIKPLCLFAFIAFSVFSTKAQEVERIEVEGKIIVDSPDVEGVTVFNTSSNRGTITNEEGRFNILVALNDELQFSALQFKNFKVVITQEIINSKELIVVLVEEVNKLPEIIILPYGLTGNLDIDALRAKTINPNLDALYFGLGNLDKFEFTDDYLSGIQNIAMDDNRLYNGVDFVKIIGFLAKPLFNKKGKDNKTLLSSERNIVEKYPPEYLIEKLNIPKNQMMEFIYFVEDSGMDKSLLEDGKELQFLDYVIKKSKEFQANKNGKN